MTFKLFRRSRKKRKNTKKVPVKHILTGKAQIFECFKSEKYLKLLNESFKKVRKGRDYLTPQETAFYKVPASKEYQAKPYTPVFLQKKDLKLESLSSKKYSREEKEVIKKLNLNDALLGRKQIGFSLSVLHFFGLTLDDFEEGYLLCSLEGMDDEGRTIRDPQAVDEDGKIITGLKKSKEFPFPRDK